MKTRQKAQTFIAVSLPPELLKKLDRAVLHITPAGEKPNRSAFVRELVRRYCELSGNIKLAKAVR